MKLDTSHMRYLTPDDFRVLTAVEMGSRNHEVVPTTLIHQIGGLRSISGTNRCISDLAKTRLIQKLRNAKYDGYRISFNGYDYLALKSMLNRGTIFSVGTTIGVGKESDIYSTSDSTGLKKVLKIHRLGRTSFKTVKNNRDYLRNRSSGSWMYLSRLAANKEYQFMSTLFTNGFNVPEPYDYSRHSILMQWIDGFPMRVLRKHSNHKKLYSDLMKFIVKLANHGLIHCDFNEFNIVIVNEDARDKYDTDFIVIDFPQCISIGHVDAEYYFKRDVECIKRFFRKKLNYAPEEDPIMIDTDGYGEGYKYSEPDFHRDVKRIAELDVQVEASGFSKKKKSDRDLEDAVESMRGSIKDGENEDEEFEVMGEDEDEDGSDYGYDDEYDSEDLEEESSDDDDDAEDLEEENERIIEALQHGVKELKMDKLVALLIFLPSSTFSWTIISTRTTRASKIVSWTTETTWTAWTIWTSKTISWATKTTWATWATWAAWAAWTSKVFSWATKTFSLTFMMTMMMFSWTSKFFSWAPETTLLATVTLTLTSKSLATVTLTLTSKSLVTMMFMVFICIF
ncbi:hypothetical protein WICMUC_004174 [Wickerhamomyces mucosus]|uniref:Serine/threonine-protein kinase RIO2 n=1 Tax=Wickerhamomyces mucosus TaxID=1378264 RepID=A0A9P8TAU4_9ASCO|nr:hypothetical protein WICMUC_004174 [Wickerhamomyces mucosus]